MHRPLWQILLTLFVLAFVLRRVAVVWTVQLSTGAGAGGPDAALLGAYGVQGLAGLGTALGLWLGRRWVLAALVVLGASVAGTALLEAFVWGVRPPAAAVGSVAATVLATGLLYAVLRHEFFSDEGTGVGTR
jgi:hypothetical protein